MPAAFEFFNTFEVNAPTCPHCAHEMSDDEMQAQQGDVCLYELARDEGSTEVTCPSPMCSLKYWLKGGYRPHYTSAMTEDDL
jgi:hypothetical protein